MQSSRGARPWLVIGLLNVVTLIVYTETYAVNLAAPTLAADLRLDLNDLLWVINVYLLVLASVAVVGGRLGDRFGGKLVLLLGLAGFTAGSLGCALAGGTPELIAARALQGTGAGLLAPQLIALTATVAPPARRGLAFGINGAVAGFAVAAGPSIGGLLTTTWGWRSVFWATLPLAVAAGVMLAGLVPRSRPGPGQVDLVGAALLMIGLVAAAYAVLEAREGPHALWAAALAAAAVVALWHQQRRRQGRDPIVPFAVLRNRPFTAMVLVAASLPASVTAMVFLSAQFFASRGVSAAASGVLLAVAPIMSLPCAVLAGRWADRPGGAWAVTAGGLACFLVGTAWVVVAIPWGPAATVPGLIVFGIGMGVVFPGPLTLAMRALPASALGSGSGVFTTGQRLGSALVAAVVGLPLQLAAGLGVDTAARIAFAVPMAVLAGAMAITMRARHHVAAAVRPERVPEHAH